VAAAGSVHTRCGWGISLDVMTGAISIADPSYDVLEHWLTVGASIHLRVDD
jgi:hypothetical protein